MSKLLTEAKWDAVKSKLLEGLSANRRVVMNAVLNNHRNNMLPESATLGAELSIRAAERIGLLAVVANVVAEYLLSNCLAS